MTLALESQPREAAAHTRRRVRTAADGDSLTPAQREWARCRHWIEEAMASSFDTIESVERGVAQGRYLFWAGPDCAAITRVDAYRNVRVLCVVYAAGNLNSLLDLGKVDLVNGARLLNCDYVSIETPACYVPMLEAEGFNPDFTVMLKRIGPSHLGGTA